MLHESHNVALARQAYTTAMRQFAEEIRCGIDACVMPHLLATSVGMTRLGVVQALCDSGHADVARAFQQWCKEARSWRLR